MHFPDAVDKELLFAGVALLSLHIASKSKSYGKRLIPLLLVLLSTLYTYFVSGETAPLSVSLIIIAAATAGDSKSLMRLWFATTAFLSLFVIAVYGLTAIFDPGSVSYILRWESGVETAVRFTFFFSHPNMVAALVMMMCGAYMYLNYDVHGSDCVISCLLCMPETMESFRAQQIEGARGHTANYLFFHSLFIGWSFVQRLTGSSAYGQSVSMALLS